MIDQDNKQEEQIQPDPLAQATLGPRARLMSLAQELEVSKAREEEAKKETQQALENVRAARENKTSIFNSLVEKRKPKYDENKEKRMRNAATIQALGDVLAQATKGFVAYGKNGAGVVPTSVNSSAMEGVEKINEMQQKYLQERKAWEDLVIKWEQQKTEDDVAAAESLYALADNSYEKALSERKSIEEKILATEKGIQDIYTSEALRTKHAEDDMARKKEYDEWLHKQGYKKTGGGTRTPSPKPEKTDYTYGQLYHRILEDVDNKESTAWGSLTKMEQDSMNSSGKNDPRTNFVTLLIQQGTTYDDAVGILQELKGWAEDMHLNLNDEIIKWLKAYTTDTGYVNIPIVEVLDGLKFGSTMYYFD